MISSVSKGMQEAMENMVSQNEDIFQVVKQDVEQEITTSGQWLEFQRRHIPLRLQQRWRI